jgi:aquaporin NIP
MRKRFVGELVGTFGVVFAPVALSASGKLPGGDGSLAAAAWVSGIAVLVMIYCFGPISSAHFNPAVTLALASARRFAWRDVPAYCAAQCAGALLAAVAVAVVFGAGPHGVHAPAPGVSVLRALGAEAVISFFLLLVILATGTDRRVSGAVPGFAIGLCVVLCVWLAGPVTGGSMNPARSLGPAVLAGGAPLASLWIYGVGPVVGALLAVLLFESVRGDAPGNA